MKVINTDCIIQTVKEMCIEANRKLSPDMEQKIRQAAEEEDSAIGKQILGQLCENMQIAEEGLEKMEAWMKKLGLTMNIRTLGATEEMIDGITESTLIMDGGYKILTKDEIKAILKASL